MSLSLSLVNTLFGASSSPSGANSLLQTLNGNAQESVADPSQSLQALNQAEVNESKEVQAIAQQPDVQRSISQFTSAVQKATSVGQLLADSSAMQVLLVANGLGDQAEYTALAQKALTSNVKDPTSLVNQLSDSRWKSVAQTYDFANQGLAVIQQPKALATIANAYAEVTWRQSVDKTTPGLSNALTFRQEASSIHSVDQILGDPVLRAVVTTALGIPQEIAFQPLEAQERTISTQLDISRFKDPSFVERFAQRYLVAAASQASSTDVTPDLSSPAVQAQGLVV